MFTARRVHHAPRGALCHWLFGEIDGREQTIELRAVIETVHGAQDGIRALAARAIDEMDALDEVMMREKRERETDHAPENPKLRIPAEIEKKILYVRREFGLGQLRIKWYLHRRGGVCDVILGGLVQQSTSI